MSLSAKHVAAELAPVDDGSCFACGPENLHGLQLDFQCDGEGRVVAYTTLAERFQGWVGFAHGGVVCMLLDEAMAHAAATLGRSCVTAAMQVRFRRPTPLGQELTIRGLVLEQRGKLVRLRAQVLDTDANLLATAEGDFIDRGPLDPQTRFGRMMEQTRERE